MNTRTMRTADGVTLAATTIGMCRTMGPFPVRGLRPGSEDEPALVLSKWMT